MRPHPDLAALFAGCPTLPAVVEAVLEGRLGSATRDGDAARLSLGCYEIFGGDPAGAGARRLIAGAARPRELVFGNDPAWRRAILAVHGDGVFDRPMQELDASGLDTAALAREEAALPEGYELRRLDAALAAQLDRELEPHGLQTFAGPLELVERGVGFGAVTGTGELACAATSYTLGSRFLEVAIATRPGHRGRGLAAAGAAALVRHSIAAGLTPCWSASNPVSIRLAGRLGYRPGGTCEVLYLG
jgi:hypothetical protein